MNSLATLAVAAVLPFAMADTSKFNQYKSVDDCRLERNILYHSAPAPYNCINIDDQTDAFYWNRGPAWIAVTYDSPDCEGNAFDLPLSSSCTAKGSARSFQLR